MLARDRAAAARQFFLARGVAETRIRTVVHPPAVGRTEEDRQKNCATYG